MIFLINASGLKTGGGLQVAQSLCNQLYRFKYHHFIVVLSSYFNTSSLSFEDNVKVVNYTIGKSFLNVIFGRDVFLDNLVKEENVDAVLTVFGPSRWKPKVPHLCGFARAQLILTNSPYNKNIGILERLKFFVWTWMFKKSSKVFYTENKYISEMLPHLLNNIKVYTVTNFYNQIFDEPIKWRRTHKLPHFQGITCLSVSTHYSHKNFEIIPQIINLMNKSHPDFKIRFVLTFNENEMHIPKDMRDLFVFLGKVDVSECPYLYEQADIMFMPTLLECFTATYPEAMRMGIPIVTTDLDFARYLCGDAACYYSAVDSAAATEAIYKVATDKDFARQLVMNGKKQLNNYDDYNTRADKLIAILEEIAAQHND